MPPNPIAEAFVAVRPDFTGFQAQLQAGVNSAFRQLKVPAGTQGQLAGAMFGPGFQQQAKQNISNVPKNTVIPAAAQATLAQRLFGPGFRNESGRAIQGALSGLRLGGLAAQFSFFGPGGAAIAVLGAGLFKATQIAADFEQQMAILGATTGASADELETASEAARQLGRDLALPGVGASDAAAGILELAKAGLDMEDAIAGAEGTLQLAIAAEIDTGTAAQIAASGLNAFGLAGDQAVHVADLLAGASIAAQGDISDMALALSQSAAVANQAGLSIEQLVGLITELARQGIRGSDAGTSIRTGLLRMIPTTKEAAQVMDALGIKIDQTQSVGDQLPELLDQYKEALSKLNPVLRQTVLNQIFGTDAIRFASIAFKEGSEGLVEATAAADVAGVAAELAASRTEGLKGQLSDLKKNAGDAALEIGSTLIPALEDYLGILNAVIDRGEDTDDLTPAQELIAGQGVNDLKDAIQLMETLDDRISEVGDNKTAEEAFARLSATLLRAERSPEEFKRLFEGTTGELAAIGRALQDGVIGPIEIAKLGATELGKIFLTALKPENLSLDVGFDESDRAKLRGDLFLSGKDTGKAYGEGVAEGITSEEQDIIDAARRTLGEVRAAGAEQILSSITSARSNLESLGTSLGGALEDIIDVGPIADEIEKVNQALDDLQEKTTRRQLGFDFSDAKADLRDARESIIQVGELTPKQKRDQEEFLKPFTEKVKDAKAALKEFDLTEHREDLEETLEAQKKAANEGVQVLIDKFEEGKISVDEFTKQLQNQLAPQLETLSANSKDLGFVFTRQFKRDMATLVKQAEALAGFQARPGTTPGTQVEKPAQTVADVQRQVAAAEKALADAIKDAKEKNTDENGSILTVLKQIRVAVGGQPSPKDDKRPN